MAAVLTPHNAGVNVVFDKYAGAEITLDGTDIQVVKEDHLMLAMGILDPTKVTRTALQNAASIACLMITTNALVSEAPKKEQADGGVMGGMDF